MRSQAVLFAIVSLLACGFLRPAFAQQHDAAEEQEIYAAVVRYQRHFSAEDNTLLFVSLYGKSAPAAFLRPLQDRKHTLRPASQMTYVKRIPADKETGKQGSRLDIRGITWETPKLVKVQADLFTGGIDGMRAPYIVIKEKGYWHIKPYQWK